MLFKLDELEEYRPKLLGYAALLDPRSKLQPLISHEDLVQMTLERAISEAKQFRGEGTLASWLRRILYNLAMDAFRKKGIQPGQLGTGASSFEESEEAIDHWVIALSSTPSSKMVREEERERIHAALGELSGHERRCVIMLDMEEMTLQKIADALNVTTKSVATAAARGRKKLKKSLRDRDQ